MIGGNHILPAVASLPTLPSDGNQGLAGSPTRACQPAPQPLHNTGCGNADGDGFKAIHEDVE